MESVKKWGIEWNQQLMEANSGRLEFENESILCLCLCDLSLAALIQPGPLQSIDGSLRLPLLQIGACKFPCTPLLSILMLITQTHREILPLLPGFYVMAMSM